MKKRLNKKIGIASIIIGVLGVVLIIFSLHNLWQEIDTKSTGDYMTNSAVEMSKIASRGGSTINEAYFQEHGKYLEGEAKVYNSILWHDRHQATIQSIIGILIASGFVIYGIVLLKS